MKNGSSEGLVAMRDDIAQLVIHNFFVRPNKTASTSQRLNDKALG
jgi:hypothetical protein